MEHHATPPYAFVTCIEELNIYLFVKILIEIQIPISRELHDAVINCVLSKRTTNKTGSVEARSLRHCCRGKEMNVKYTECVSVSLPQLFGMQIVSFLRCIILSSVACLALPSYCTLSHKQQDYRKKIVEHKMRTLNVCTTLV